MQFRNNVFLSFIFLGSGIVSAIPDLETVRTTIIATISRDHPACITEFNNFFKKYDDLVSNFFSKKNNDSLKTHINYMEEELHLLKKVCDDARYRNIQPILSDYYTDISELIVLLKDYVGSHDTFSLAYKVRKFKTILPIAVKERGDISLFWALHHRLRC